MSKDNATLKKDYHMKITTKGISILITILSISVYCGVLKANLINEIQNREKAEIRLKSEIDKKVDITVFNATFTGFNKQMENLNDGIKSNSKKLDKIIEREIGE